MKKRNITVNIEFFKNQDPDTIEQLLRRLVEQKRFPAFHRCMVMVNHKNLKSIKNNKSESDFPVVEVFKW